MDIDELLNRFSTYARIADGSKTQYEIKPKKQKLFFGCNYQNIPTIVIEWSEKGRGFGEYAFQIINDKMVCHNERDSRESVKRVLCQMVDDCIFDDEIEGE